MNLFLIGSISGFLVVILGAFGAHGLKAILDNYGISVYEKAVLYQMFHTLIIFVLAIMEYIIPGIHVKTIGLIFLFGIILFSGSLYLLAITGIKSFGIITPIGGFFFVIGWLLLILKVF